MKSGARRSPADPLGSTSTAPSPSSRRGPARVRRSTRCARGVAEDADADILAVLDAAPPTSHAACSYRRRMKPTGFATCARRARSTASRHGKKVVAWGSGTPPRLHRRACDESTCTQGHLTSRFGSLRNTTGSARQARVEVAIAPALQEPGSVIATSPHRVGRGRTVCTRALADLERNGREAAEAAGAR